MLQGHSPLCEPTAVIARATVSLECIGSLMHVSCFFVNGATAYTNATNLVCGILMLFSKIRRVFNYQLFENRIISSPYGTSQ